MSALNIDNLLLDKPCLQPPPIHIDEKKYEVRFARSEMEIDAVLKLRFDIFNLELGEGMESSFQTLRDEDEFDGFCHHLIVIDKETHRIIGTYRMQTSDMARRGIGFYSGVEFNLNDLPQEVTRQAVEVGRACITKAHRNRRVLFLLWKGLAAYMCHFRMRYLFGCCSLTSQDPREGRQVMAYFEENGLLNEQLHVWPQPGYACYEPGFEVDEPMEVNIPRLFRTYLNYGAKICGPPAIDRLFRTIDFLVILDIARLDSTTQRMFFPDGVLPGWAQKI